MRATAKKRGNSASGPKQMRPKRYDLAKLLAGIRPRNLHAEIDFGPPVGKEAR